MREALTIDRDTPIPVYVQLEEQIRLLIRRGALMPGDAMPTVRALAVELGVNANTVSRVYGDLRRQGLLRLERGVGTFVDGRLQQPSVEKRDFARIEKTARSLVSQSRELGVSRRELSELITALWRENQ